MMAKTRIGPRLRKKARVEMPRAAAKISTGQEEKNQDLLERFAP
jgi:hypothetical protein